MRFPKKSGIYIIDLNENSKETRNRHIYNSGFDKIFTPQTGIYIYISGGRRLYCTTDPRKFTAHDHSESEYKVAEIWSSDYDSDHFTKSTLTMDGGLHVSGTSEQRAPPYHLAITPWEAAKCVPNHLGSLGAELNWRWCSRELLFGSALWRRVPTPHWFYNNI